MKHLTILTIISTTIVCSTTVEPTRDMDDISPQYTVEPTRDMDDISSQYRLDSARADTFTAMIPTINQPRLGWISLSCPNNPYNGNYKLVNERLREIDHAARHSDEHLVPYIRGANERDDVSFRPRVFHLGEVLSQTDLGGKVYVADVVALTETTTESDIQIKRFKTESLTTSPISVQRVVLKTDHDDLPPIGLLQEGFFVKEFAFRVIINDTDISPKVYQLTRAAYITPAAELPHGTPRFMGSYLRETSSRGIAARYIVQEQAGPSLHAFAKYHQKKIIAKPLIMIIRKLLDRLEALHSRGIVHGDIRAENIVFKTPVNDIDEIRSFDFLLIDFQRAIFFPDKFGSSITKVGGYSYIKPEYLSIWQLAGERMGPRDDIYQLVYMLGNLLSNGSYRNFVECQLEERLRRSKLNLSRTSERFLEIEKRVELDARQNIPLFRRSDKHGGLAWTGLRMDLDKTIADKLELIHSHVVNTYVHPDMEIDYGLIRAAFDEVISLFPY